MAQKRAIVAATLLAVNASEFFTQDVEDMAIPLTAPVVAPLPRAEESASRASANASGQKGDDEADAARTGAQTYAGDHDPSRLTAEILAACRALGKTEAQLAQWLGKKYGVESLEVLTPHDRREVLSFLKSRAAA